MKAMSKELERVLCLDLPPVGVKFLKPEEVDEYKNYNSEVRYTYCQFIMKAHEGEKLMAVPGNVSCANGASALGFLPVPDKLKTGAFLEQLGSFEKEAGRTVMEELPRLEFNQYAAIIVSRLETADFEPDIIVVESKPEHIMWLALSVLHHEGGRLVFSTAISNGVCVDVTVIPHLTQKLNVTLGCYGCRNATSINDEHLLAGFPRSKLEAIMRSLKMLDEKAIPRTKGKKAYQRLVASEKKKMGV